MAITVISINSSPKTYLAAVAAGIKAQSRSVHIEKMDEVGAEAERLFKDRLGKPYARRNRPSVSGTGHGGGAPGRVYGRGGRRNRGSGTYTFGKASDTSAAFHGSLYQGNEKGFGYPHIKDANVRTKNTWRALEFGLPSALHRMPRHYWVNARGVAGKGRAYTEFRPGRASDSGRGAYLKGPGIRAKKFIRDAWRTVMKTMPKAYKQMIVGEFKHWEGRPDRIKG